MKNLLKLFGIIALVAIIGFSFVACGNGTTEGNDGDDGGAETVLFHTDDDSTDPVILFSRVTSSDTLVVATLTGTKLAAAQALTKDDIVFTPADVATVDSITVSDSGITLSVTELKTGQVTVSIKDKNGVKFTLVDHPSARNTFYLIK